MKQDHFLVVKNLEDKLTEEGTDSNSTLELFKTEREELLLQINLSVLAARQLVFSTT